MAGAWVEPRRKRAGRVNSGKSGPVRSGTHGSRLEFLRLKGAHWPTGDRRGQHQPTSVYIEAGAVGPIPGRPPTPRTRRARAHPRGGQAVTSYVLDGFWVPDRLAPHSGRRRPRRPRKRAGHCGLGGLGTARGRPDLLPSSRWAGSNARAALTRATTPWAGWSGRRGVRRPLWAV
jgi:hypothetical protein